MSEEVVRIPIEELQTFAGRCRHLYTIQPKDGPNEKFEFLEAQEYLNDIIEHEFKRTKKELGHSQCKAIILKPRQIGATTFSNIKSLDMQIQHEGSNGVIVAHDSDTTEKIYRIYQRAYENLPDYVIPTKDDKDMSKRQFYKYSLSDKQLRELDFNLSSQEFQQTHKVKIKPDTFHQSGKRMGFEDTDSITSIFTAGKGDAGGLGGTVKRCHMSECGNYPAYKDLMTSLKPSIPKFADNVFFVLESTANGTTGEGEGFYKAWERATAEWEKYKKGESQIYGGFRPIFIPWYMIDEYEMPLAGGKYLSIDNVDFGSKEKKQEFLDREQKLLNDGIYNPLTREMQVLTPEKINWYRYIIREDCEFDYREAQRFYPTTPEEAFVASSNCFFDSMKLNEVKNQRINEGEPDCETGDLLWSKQDSELEFRPSPVGDLKVWKHPEKNWENRYVIGADLGRGHEDGDYSVAYVKDRLTQEFVACFHGKVDQDIFAEALIELGIYYNEALLVPENNLDTVVEIIKPSGHTPYIGELYYNESGNTIKYGYWTSSSTRQILIDKYKGWLRDNQEGYDVLRDTQMIDEHLSFVRHQTKNGVKYEADEGSHDDRVIAAALAHYGDFWWDRDVSKYEPNKIKELISKSPNSRRKDYMRNSDLGRSKRGR